MKPGRSSEAPTRVDVSNLVLPTRWSQPIPIPRIEAAARTLSVGVTRLEEARSRHEGGPARSAGPPAVLFVGTLDTKGEELGFLRDLVVAAGLRARLVDVSTSGKALSADVSAQEVALNHPRGGAAVFAGDRGAAVIAMAEAFV